jgi:quinol monooxygenase YgiN
MSKVGAFVKLTARDGQRDALIAHLLKSVDQAKSEQETEVWIVSSSPSEPNTVWLTEIYSSQEAQAAHSNSPAAQASLGGAMEFVAGMPEVILISPAGGKGLNA